jgi:hypothetical protein
MWSVS